MAGRSERRSAPASWNPEALLSLRAFIQARLGSSRLPGKVLRPLAGRPMIWHIVQRLRKAEGVEDVVVLTTDRPQDDPLHDFCVGEGIPVFRGNETDVLDRYYQAALRFAADPVVRITGDCPFVDPEVVARLIRMFRDGAYDHVGVAAGAGAVHMKEGRFPNGLDAECFSFQALERAWREARDPAHREHVTPYIWRNKDSFRCGVLTAERDYSKLRLTVDFPEDFDLASRIYEALYREGKPFLLKDIAAFVEGHPEVASVNRSRVGQEGYARLWKGPPR